jgi:ATP-dependent DNA helicase RecQ
LTEEGRAVLKERRPVTLTKPVAAPKLGRERAGEIACDEALFERLRQLRKNLADQRSVPPYIVFSDVALRQMARYYPANERDFARISGVGQRKLEEFGGIFLGEIATHLQTYPRQMFADDSFNAPAPRRSDLNDTVRETLRRFRGGEPVAEIASHRGFTPGTIYGHLATALEAGEPIELDQFFTGEEQVQVAAAFARTGFGNLSGAQQLLGSKFDYGRLRLYRAAHNRAARTDREPG